MLIIRTRDFTVFIILIIALFLFGAIFGYVALMERAAKIEAEQLLFYGMIVVFVILFFSIRILIFTSQAFRKFDKIIDMVARQGILPRERLKYFGKFGEKIQKLYGELDDLGERKSRRIRQQNDTIDKLLEFINTPLLIADATGEIRKISGGFAEKNKISPADAAGKQLREFIDELDFQAVLLEADRTKSIVYLEKDKTRIAFYPVLSDRNDVSYFITVFGHHELAGHPGEGDQSKASLQHAAGKNLFGKVLDLLKRK